MSFFYNLLSYESTILTSPDSAEKLREFLATLINPFCKNKDEIEETEYELLRLYEEDGYIIFSPIEEKEFEEKFNKLIQRIMVNSYKIGEFASKARK